MSLDITKLLANYVLDSLEPKMAFTNFTSTLKADSSIRACRCSKHIPRLLPWLLSITVVVQYPLVHNISMRSLRGHGVDFFITFRTPRALILRHDNELSLQWRIMNMDKAISPVTF